MFRPLRPSALALDLSIAAVAFLTTALYILGSSSGITFVTEVTPIAFLAVGLALRRVSPGLALASVWVGALIQLFAGLSPNGFDLVILPVLFASAAYGSPVIKWLGFASTFIGAAAVALYLVMVFTLRDYYLTDVLVTHQNLSSPGLGTAFVGNTVMTFLAALALFMLSWVLGLLSKTFGAARESRKAQSAVELEKQETERLVVVEQERNRIARDMHDVVAHSLVVVIAQADGARYVRESDPAAADDALATISATARDALADVRLLLGQLRHRQAAGPQPVLGDLDRLFNQFRTSGIGVVVDVSGVPTPLGA